jgi:UMF1 family MFS transporter
MAGFFPIFFKQYSNADVPQVVSTFRLGTAATTAGFVVAFLAPVLGAIADRGSSRKRFLFAFALLGATLTASLATLEQGDWQRAWLFYVVATIGFFGANVFYDSLIIDVAPRELYDRVSGLGFGLGYLGGGLLFTLNVLLTLHPEWFGLSDPGEAVRWSFVMVALWWIAFSVPLLVWVRERPTTQRESSFAAIRAGLRQLAETLRELRALRTVALFLAAYWLYIDGVDTIIVMAVDYGLALGLPQKSLITALPSRSSSASPRPSSSVCSASASGRGAGYCWGSPCTCSSRCGRRAWMKRGTSTSSRPSSDWFRAACRA